MLWERIWAIVAPTRDPLLEMQLITRRPQYILSNMSAVSGLNLVRAVAANDHPLNSVSYSDSFGEFPYISASARRIEKEKLRSVQS